MIRNALAVALALMMAAGAMADPVTIANFSFEDPAQDPGGWTNTLPSWDPPPVAANAFIEYIAGFTSDGVNHLGMEQGGEVSQNLGVSLLPNTTYDLTVGVGRRNATFTVAGNESRYGLYVGGDAGGGGTLLADATYDASPLADSTFVDRTLTYTTGGTPPAGNLWVSLRSTGVNRAHYDNVRLTAVPEPSCIMLVLCGLMGLLHYRRRS
jgi:hypothetical protein